MSRIAKLFILSFFVFFGAAFAEDQSNLRIHLGDDGDAFKQVSVNKKALTSDDRKTLKSHHKEIKAHHNEHIGSGGYKVIHMDKRPSGTLESAIKFKHPEGGEFVYQSVVKPEVGVTEGHKLKRATHVYGAYRETLNLHQAESKDDFIRNLRKDFGNVQEIISSAKMIGDNFKGLSDKDFQRQFKRISKMIDADSMKVHKYASSVQGDKYLKYLHQYVDSVNQSMEGGIQDRDLTNRYYENFRDAFDEFYSGRFKEWESSLESAKQNLKEATRVISARHPGKFEPAPKKSWGDKFSSLFSSDEDNEEDEE